MNVLLVGVGSIGKKHLAAIRQLEPTANIWALRSRTPSETLDGVINLYDTAALDGLTFDYALIATPTSTHRQTIESLLALHCPLFIEKPLHDNLAVRDLVDIIQQHHLLPYVACNLRFLDCLGFVKNALEQQPDKRLNEVNVYCGSYLPDWRKNTDFRQSYSARPELGGGVHLDLIHELDYLYWLFGHPESVISTRRNQSSLQVPAVDYAHYLLDYKTFCAAVTLNYYRRDPKRNLELVFDTETWTIDLLKNAVYVNEVCVFSSPQTMADTYLAQMAYFHTCLRTGQSSQNTVTDAYTVLKLCLHHDTER